LFVSERNSEGKKCLVMKQFLSQEKLEEIQEIIEMKITHRYHSNFFKNIQQFHAVT
jgi:hypothetical protein